MKTLSELLIELKSFDSDIDFVHDKTIEEFVADCPRGEWLLWLGKQIAIDRKKLIIACARCVTTVEYLIEQFEHTATAEELMSGALSKIKQRETADICRRYIGYLIINKVNKLLK